MLATLMLVLAFLLMTYLVIGFVRSARRSRRQSRGQCPQCGYDLRASSERCPECGMALLGPEARQAAPNWPRPVTPIEPRKPRADDELVCVHATTNAIAAAGLCDQLITAGVFCRVETLAASNVQSLSERRLMVWSDDRARALEVLKILQARKRFAPGAAQDYNPENQA